MNLPSALQLRGLRPALALAATKPHGVRVKYIAGCRCAQCRKANSKYENERQKARRLGDWNGIVPAERARAHLLRLSKIGVGRRAVGAATDISDSILVRSRSGDRTHIRARTERKILAVTKQQISDGGLVSVAPTLRLIRDLLDEGYTEKNLAKHLGYISPVLQFKTSRITARNAQRIAKMYQDLTS